MRLTIERVLPPEIIEALYPRYLAAFEPVRTKAAARHLLTADEFAQEMRDERIDKYVAWDDADGEPVGATTLVTDLAAVPWISPEFYARRYPEQYGRGAVFYLGISFVDPHRRCQGAYVLMMGAVGQRLIRDRAVCAYDVCAHNAASGSGRNVAALCRIGKSRIDDLDTQIYRAAVFDGPLDNA